MQPPPTSEASQGPAEEPWTGYAADRFGSATFADEVVRVDLTAPEAS